MRRLSAPCLQGTEERLSQREKGSNRVSEREERGREEGREGGRETYAASWFEVCQTTPHSLVI